MEASYTEPGVIITAGRESVMADTEDVYNAFVRKR